MVSTELCPITGELDARLVGSWSAEEMIRLWAEDIGIDVSDWLDDRQVINLWHGGKSDLQFFRPIVTGDMRLYSQLRTKPWYLQPDRWEFHAAARHISESDRVLDLGAGQQPFRNFVAPGRYSAIDPHAETPTASAGQDSFDVVCAFQVLEHVADPLAFVSEAKAWLKPGGLLFIAVPNRESYVGRLRDFPLDLPPHHVTRWSERALKSLAQRAGLQVEAITPSPLEPWETPLYWMARLEQWLPRPSRGRNRWSRVVAYLGGRGLAAMAPRPRGAPGGSLLMRARPRLEP